MNQNQLIKDIEAALTKHYDELNFRIILALGLVDVENVDFCHSRDAIEGICEAEIVEVHRMSHYWVTTIETPSKQDYTGTGNSAKTSELSARMQARFDEDLIA
jgi:hypothetical protein